MTVNGPSGCVDDDAAPPPVTPVNIACMTAMTCAKQSSARSRFRSVTSARSSSSVAASRSLTATCTGATPPRCQRSAIAVQSPQSPARDAARGDAAAVGVGVGAPSCPTPSLTNSDDMPAIAHCSDGPSKNRLSATGVTRTERHQHTHAYPRECDHCGQAVHRTHARTKACRHSTHARAYQSVRTASGGPRRHGAQRPVLPPRLAEARRAQPAPRQRSASAATPLATSSASAAALQRTCQRKSQRACPTSTRAHPASARSGDARRSTAARRRQTAATGSTRK
jgi:hypothetical protein